MKMDNSSLMPGYGAVHSIYLVKKEWKDLLVVAKFANRILNMTLLGEIMIN